MPKISNDKLLNDPLKIARGTGSAHHGVEHWNAQKITAIALVPLNLWFIFSMISLYSNGGSYEAFIVWTGQPLNTTLLIAMMISMFYHAKLGVDVVVEDYISCVCLRKAKMLFQKLLFWFLTIASVVSILKIAFLAAI